MCSVPSEPPSPCRYFPRLPALEAVVRIKADGHVMPGTAWMLTGQVTMRRRQWSWWRQRVETEVGEGPGASRPLKPPVVCPPAQEKLCGSFRMNHTHPSLSSQIPFLPSPCPCVFFLVSLSLCPSLCSVSLCLSPHQQVCVCSCCRRPPPHPAPTLSFA